MQDRDRQGGQEESEDDRQVSGSCHLSVGLGKLLLGHQLRYDAPLDGPEESALQGEQEEDGEHREGPSRVERWEGQQQEDQFGPLDDHDEVPLAVAVGQRACPV